MRVYKPTSYIYCGTHLRILRKSRCHPCQLVGTTLNFQNSQLDPWTANGPNGHLCQQQVEQSTRTCCQSIWILKHYISQGKSELPMEPGWILSPVWIFSTHLKISMSWRIKNNKMYMDSWFQPQLSKRRSAAMACEEPKKEMQKSCLGMT